MRSRITITLSENILKQVDKTIDKHTVRNRSQAIESLLRQAISPSLSTAVILAGGPVVTHPSTKQKLPKALTPIKDIPLIDHQLKHLKAHGFTKVVLCTGSESHQDIIAHCGNGKKYNLDIQYSQEKTRLGTGGALKFASHKIPKEPFLLIHGDVITDINLTEFINFYTESEKLAAVAVKRRPGKLSYGQVYLEGNSIINFHQPTEKSAISLVNTGIYIFDHQVLKFLPEKVNFKIEETLIPQLVKQNQISGYVFQGLWFDISESEDYQEANTRWLTRL